MGKVEEILKDEQTPFRFIVFSPLVIFGFGSPLMLILAIPAGTLLLGAVLCLMILVRGK